MDLQPLADALHKFSEIICGKRRWDDFRDELLEECQTLFRADVCAIFLIRGKQIELEGHRGYTKANGEEIDLKELREHLRYEVGTATRDGKPNNYDGITGQVATTGAESSYEASQPQPLSWSGKPDKLGIWNLEERPFRCMFAVPLSFDNETRGVLKVENKRDSHNNPATFTEVDKTILRALGNLFSIAVRLSYYRGLPYQELFKTTVDWLEDFDRQNLYQNMVNFCAKIFRADICALFVRIEEDNGPKMTLVAGRLSRGESMDPAKLKDMGKDPTYSIGLPGDSRFDGITGRIASTGEPVLLNSFTELEALRPGETGKWDEVVWNGDPANNFGAMIGVPLKFEGEPRYVLKVERRKTNKPSPFFHEDLDALILAAEGLVKYHRQLFPQKEEEYRIALGKPMCFFAKPIGRGVVIQHLKTSICKSDLSYFKHEKEPHQLSERLPMVLGHETTGKILRTSPDARYLSGDKIQTGDKVFVIPLIPCESCEVCKGEYGENYCPSARFMASNSPGSLRSSYAYESKLTLKIPDDLEDLAVLAEPTANIVQLLTELGFEDNSINLHMKPFAKEHFTYFRVKGQQFTNTFNTIVDQVPNPRTLFVLSGIPTEGPQIRTISQRPIMTKGLGLLGQRSVIGSDDSFIRKVSSPRILILGTSVSAYLLAATLRFVFNIPPGQITVTGRTPEKLNQFDKLVGFRFPVSGLSLEQCSEHLLNDVGTREGYDVAFECIGGDAVEKHIQLALEVLKNEGTLALFGLSEEPINIDFGKVIANELYIKGSYRANLQAYQDALNYITQHASLRDALENIIDDETEVAGFKPKDNHCKAHDIHSAKHLTEFFKTALARKTKKLGRMIVGSLGNKGDTV